MTYTRKVAYNTLAQMVGRIVLIATSLVIVGILTRHLGVENFGRYTTAFAFVAFFGIFGDLGFFYILVKELSVDAKSSQKIIANVMSIRTIGALIAYGVGIAVAFLIPSYDHITRLAIVIATLAFFWQTIQNTLTVIFQVHFRMDKAIVCDIVSRFITLGIIAWLASRGYGLVPIMSAYLAGNFASFVLAYFLSLKYTPIKFGFDFPYWKELIVKTLPMGVALVLHFVYFRIDTLMLSVMKGAEHVGIYGPSYKILEVMFILPGIFISSVLPIYARYLAKKDIRIHDAVQKAFDFLAIVGVPIIVGVFLLASPIVAFIAGDEFLNTSFVNLWGHPANSATNLQILIFASIGSFFAPVFIQLLVAGGHQKKLILPNIIFAIFNVILNLLFIPRWSYVATSFNTVATELLVLLMMTYLSYKTFKIFPRLTALLKAIVSSLAMGGVIWMFRDLNLFILILLGVLVYFGSMLILGGVNKSMLKQFKN